MIQENSNKQEAVPQIITATRLLPLEYKIHGRHFKQVKRSDKAAIYEGREDGDDVSSPSFEVFVIKRKPAVTIKPKGKVRHIPAREVMPGDEQFGVLAWSVNTMYHAEKIFEEINQGHRPKPMVSSTSEPDNIL